MARARRPFDHIPDLVVPLPGGPDSMPAWAAQHLTDKQTILPFPIRWRWLLPHSQLPGVPRSIAHYVSTWASVTEEGRREKHQERRCWPTTKQISERSGFTERTIIRNLPIIEESGFLKIVRYRWRHAPNDYWLDLPVHCRCGCDASEVTESHPSEVTESQGWGDGESPMTRQRVTHGVTESPSETSKSSKYSFNESSNYPTPKASDWISSNEEQNQTLIEELVNTCAFEGDHIRREADLVVKEATAVLAPHVVEEVIFRAKVLKTQPRMPRALWPHLQTRAGRASVSLRDIDFDAESVKEEGGF